MDHQKVTTEALKQILKEDAYNPDAERDVDFLFQVMEELEKRHCEENPVEAAASDIRAKAWWQLANDEISQAEYRDIVLFTALSEEEKQGWKSAFCGTFRERCAAGSKWLRRGLRINCGTG